MSAAGPIVVVARWQVPATALVSVLAFVAQLRLHTLAEPGCLGYEVFQGVDRPGGLLLLERYRDDAAIEAHRGSPHYRELAVEKILPLLADRKVELLQAVAT